MSDLNYNPNTQTFEDFYMNQMQIRANLVDSNVLICEVARAAGKTEGVMTPRIIRVANSMPGELGFWYIKLMPPCYPMFGPTYRLLFLNLFEEICRECLNKTLIMLLEKPNCQGILNVRAIRLLILNIPLCLGTASTCSLYLPISGVGCRSQWCACLCGRNETQ